MPHNRPRAGMDTAPSYTLIVATLLAVAVLGLLAVRSGAIDTLNASGLFGG